MTLELWILGVVLFWLLVLTCWVGVALSGTNDRIDRERDRRRECDVRLGSEAAAANRTSIGLMEALGYEYTYRQAEWVLNKKKA